MKFPTRGIRTAVGEPVRDQANRTIVSTIMTRRLARDGGIIKPEGLETRNFMRNPVVQALHGQVAGAGCPVIGRALAVERTRIGFDAKTQFAETDLGREYAYLYGLNPKGEIFMRGWSIGWDTKESQPWTIEQARQYLGADWDEADAQGISPTTVGSVWVIERAELLEYSAVPVGADREALSRAFGAGVRLAGALVAKLDLDNAETAIAALRDQGAALASRLTKLEQDIQALRGEGASAAARGDSDALLREINNLVRDTRARFAR